LGRSERERGRETEIEREEWGATFVAWEWKSWLSLGTRYSRPAARLGAIGAREREGDREREREQQEVEVESIKLKQKNKDKFKKGGKFIKLPRKDVKIEKGRKSTK